MTAVFTKASQASLLLLNAHTLRKCSANIKMLNFEGTYWNDTWTVPHFFPLNSSIMAANQKKNKTINSLLILLI